MRYTLEMPFFGSRRIKPPCLAGRQVLKRSGISCREKKGTVTDLRASMADRYPALLRNAEITRANQVWGSDITYIRLSKGFVYLVAIMDWFSRYVISRELSTSLEVEFCIRALRRRFFREYLKYST